MTETYLGWDCNQLSGLEKDMVSKCFLKKSVIFNIKIFVILYLVPYCQKRYASTQMTDVAWGQGQDICCLNLQSMLYIKAVSNGESSTFIFYRITHSLIPIFSHLTITDTIFKHLTADLAPLYNYNNFLSSIKAYPLDFEACADLPI